VSFELTYCNL